MIAVQKGDAACCTRRRCPLFASANSGLQSVSPCALCFLQIVGAAFCYFIYAGAILSARFDAGGSLDGGLRGLYPGWLFGRRMARRHLPCGLACTRCTSNLHAVDTSTLVVESSAYCRFATAFRGEKVSAASS